LLDLGESAGPAVRLITIGDDRPPGGSGFNEVVDSARSELVVTARSAGDLAIVGYTSGTTGLPKGAVMGQRASFGPHAFRTGDLGRLDAAG
jgi:acyl-coenzyme A synthetase/AMP-(fatty) acid ligase